MAAGTEELKTRLRALVGAENLIDSGDTLEALSKDYYWYSPVLRRQLEDKRADMAVRPASLGELRSVVSACWRARSRCCRLASPRSGTGVWSRSK